MPDSKLTALTADTAPTSDDLLYVVNDPSGTPGSKKATAANVITKAHGLSDGAVVSVVSGVLASNAVTSSAAELNILDGATLDVTELNYVDGVTSSIQTQINAKQPLDSDLTTIAGLTATTDNFIQSKASAWASRTPTQVTADLIAMVGDSGSGGTKGLVPAPAAGDASKFLKGDATWASIPGGGDALVANPLSQFAATTSLQLKGVISDETGSGALVFANTPTLVTPILGTPTSGTLTNCTGLPLAGVTDSTTEALGVGSLEVGHATDTTITRVSAGVIAVEGVDVITASNTETLSNKSIAGALTLEENASIALDPAGSADGKYSGITIAGVAGYTQAFGDLVTLDKDDSRWEAVDISVAAAATGDARGILGMVVSAGTDGNACTILLSGVIRADANFPTLTIGANVYASTAGDIVVTQPTTTDHVIRIVGSALTADEIFFRPDFLWFTHV